jgi:hypothetical protein
VTTPWLITRAAAISPLESGDERERGGPVDDGDRLAAGQGDRRDEDKGQPTGPVASFTEAECDLPDTSVQTTFTLSPG